MEYGNNKTKDRNNKTKDKISNEREVDAVIGEAEKEAYDAEHQG